MVWKFYINFWKKAFVFKERINRDEFIYPLIINTLIGSVFFGLWIFFRYEYFLGLGDIENPLLIYPRFFYFLVILFVIPTWSSVVRRLNDVGTPWNRVFYFFIPIYKFWLYCLLLKPSKDKEISLEEEKKKSYFQRRKNAKLFLIGISLIICPVTSYFFGIRHRSAELAFMPVGIATFIVNLFNIFPNLFLSENSAAISLFTIFGYFIGSTTASYYGLKIVRKNLNQ